jgi:hypothetical protein
MPELFATLIQKGPLMIRRLILSLVACAILGVSGYGDDKSAEKPVEQPRIKEVKKVAKQFAKAFFKHRDVEDVMDLVAMPHGYGWGDLSRVIGNSDELKKAYEFAIAEDNRFRPDQQKWTFELLETRTYEQMLATEWANLPEGNRRFNAACLKNDDMVVHVRMKYMGKSDRSIYVWVSWRDGEPKVVGWYLVVGADG